MSAARGEALLLLVTVLATAAALLPAMRGYGAGLHPRAVDRLLAMRPGEDYLNETSANATQNETVPPTWEELVERVKEGRFSEFRRHPAMQKSYDEFRALVLEDWWTFEDYVTCRVYDIPYVTVRGKRRAHRCWSTDPKRRILKANDFPYLLPKGVKHVVYWTTDEELLSREYLEEFVKLHHPIDDVICWANPFSMKSFPRIPHAHVLVRPNKFYRPVKQPFHWLYPPDKRKTFEPFLPGNDDELAREQWPDGKPPSRILEAPPIQEGTFTFYEPTYDDADADYPLAKE